MKIKPKVVQQKPVKDNKPDKPGMWETETEFRIDLPFDLHFDNLAYIGVNVLETWHVQAHYHDHFELCFVEEGEGWFAIDDFLYQVRSGDLFLTKPGEAHQGAAAGNLPFRLYYLGFQLEQMRNLEADYHKIGVNRVAKDQNGLVKRMCDAIIEEIRNHNSHTILMVQGLFLQLLVTTLRLYGNRGYTEEQSPLSLSPALRKVLDRLQTDINKDYDIDELAKGVHLSRSHLSREFKRYMGITVGQYIRSLRLDCAKHYLRETTESISVIAEKLHFSSIHTFSIFFKRHTGESPQEFRQSIHKRGDL